MLSCEAMKLWKKKIVLLNGNRININKKIEFMINKQKAESNSIIQKRIENFPNYKWLHKTFLKLSKSLVINWPIQFPFPMLLLFFIDINYCFDIFFDWNIDSCFLENIWLENCYVGRILSLKKWHYEILKLLMTKYTLQTIKTCMVNIHELMTSTNESFFVLLCFLGNWISNNCWLIYW